MHDCIDNVIYHLIDSQVWSIGSLDVISLRVAANCSVRTILELLML